MNHFEVKLWYDGARSPRPDPGFFLEDYAGLSLLDALECYMDDETCDEGEARAKARELIAIVCAKITPEQFADERRLWLGEAE